MNLYQKILAVMADIRYLNKDDKVDIGNGRSYRAVTEEKVTSAIKESLIKNGLVLLPIEINERREDEDVADKYGNIKRNRITTVHGSYKIVNVDKPEEYEILSAVGCGVDTQDKGAAKAQTMLYKYLLLRTFAIPTGDDPDKISSDVYTEMLVGKPEPKEEPPKMMSKEENWNVICGLFELNGKTAEDAKAWIESRYKLPFDKLTATQIATAKVDVARKSNGTSGK